MGRHDDAIQEQHLALKLDPLYTYAGESIVASLFVARRYDEAIEHGKRALSLHPVSAFGYIRLGLVYAQKGMLTEALDAFERAGRLTDDPIRPKLARYRLRHRPERRA